MCLPRVANGPWHDRHECQCFCVDDRYNGHPDFTHMSKEFSAALSSSDTVAVVGVGNVALDCARILAKGEKFMAISR